MKQEKLDELVELAWSWSKDLHKGQTYAFGDDYFESHIEKVVEAVEYLTQSDQYSRTDKTLAVVIAYLHDTVEDTQCTSEDIRATFGSRVSSCVLNLTKGMDEPRESQWSRARRDPLSLVVKKADMLVNLKASLASNRLNLVDKYTEGLRYLTL